MAAQDISEPVDGGAEEMTSSVLAVPQPANKSQDVQQMFKYADSVSRDIDGKMTDVYVKWRIHTDRDNPSLFLVPSLYVIAKGNRDYIEEYYSTIKFHDFSSKEETQRVTTGTIPHNRQAFPSVAQLFTPDIYAPTLFKPCILSPFNKKNRKYYKYKSVSLQDGTVSITFVPRFNNTQLVIGKANTEKTTGRILSADISGDFDMLSFRIMIRMRDDDSVLPSRCDLIVLFKFTGNKVRSEIVNVFLPPRTFPKGVHTSIDSLRTMSLYGENKEPLPKGVHTSIDSLRTTSLYGENKDPLSKGVHTSIDSLRTTSLYGENKEPLQKRVNTPIDSLRPIPLTDKDLAIYAQYDSLKRSQNHEVRLWQKKLYTVAWNEIGETLVNNFKTTIGQNNEFSLKTSPVLNPSYLTYSHSKGICYRFDLNGRYVFTRNSDFYFKVKTGYMFNHQQFYFDAPFTYTYDASRNGTVRFTIGNGNRITNSSVIDQLRMSNPDSIDFSNLKLDYFKDMYMKLNTTYDLTDWLSTDIGVVFHHRIPVKKADFISGGLPTMYRTFAPMVELSFKPFRKYGPAFTLDYERGIKGVIDSDLDYERWESNVDWIVKLDPLSSLSMRLGYGLYTNTSQSIYFLDFTNFHENNLPGGWNDDWSGDFQLLNSAWYNMSKFYLRSNVTFEHPMFFASFVPYFGHFVENERIYVNSLIVDHIHPYMEYGYSFTTRYFSAGVFASTRNWKYQSIGFRFTVELFGRWR